MDDIQYIGEHLLPKALGEIVTVVGFAAILFAAISYFFSMRTDRNADLITIARRLFSIHALATLGLIGLMFFVMFNRYYEYAYAFEHVSDDLPFVYMFSAFWEGQQGSFLLWMFWHIILGFVLMRKAGKWEPGVLFTLCIIQTWLSSMLLGVYVPFTEFKIGDNPMLLLRDVLDAPIFANEDYLKLIEGKGLNLLLQNYWNVIHPPITFLGFASAAIPFSFAMAGLFNRQFNAWLRPALPWVLFSIGILGVGILMGSAWAYEALTFGGYWAWDPVENMSLVPWIMLLAGMHAHLITQATGYSRRSVYLFYILAFCLSIYSTYLVRSGALEETSVHAFTEMGMGPQLTAFLLFFVLGSAALLIRNWKKIPAPQQEESLYSREFWMFVGLMILAISSILITYSTSLPVINSIVRLFNPEYQGQVIQDANEHYNKYQLWIAVFIGLLSGMAQWIRYKNSTSPSKTALIRSGVHGLITIATTFFITSALQTSSWPITILLAAAIYGIVANGDYLVSKLRSNLKMSGAVLSHIGFGIMILGIVISGINKRHISQNPTLMAGIFNEDEEDLMLRNVVLLKNEPVFGQGYLMEYERDTFIGTERQYFVTFKKLNAAGEMVDSFAANPNVIYSEEFDDIEVYHPSIRRQVHKDYFTRIATLPKAEVDPEFAQAVEDTLSYSSYQLAIGDTLDLTEHKIIASEIIRNPPSKGIPTFPEDKIIGLGLNIINKSTGQQYDVIPKAILRGNLSYVLPEKINPEELRIKLADSILMPYLPYSIDDFESNFQMKEGDYVAWQDMRIQFEGFKKQTDHPFYSPQKDDIAISAHFVVQNNLEERSDLYPTYIIRNMTVQHEDDYCALTGTHIRFVSIDPATETIEIALRYQDPTIQLAVAERVPRTDFVVVEAIAFPGINLFWIGAILMLGGLFFSWSQRRRQART